MHPKRRRNRVGMFSIIHPLKREHAHLFEDVVRQTSPISFHSP
jgi:hypothetical protein